MINGWGGAVVTGGVCGGAGLPAFQLHIPVVGVNGFLYNWNAPAAPVAPVAAIPGLNGNRIEIDLHELQQDIINGA
jgi:hypothetical protein